MSAPRDVLVSPLHELTSRDLIVAVSRLFDPLNGWHLSDEWRCLYIDYEHPHVFRMWRQVGDKRLFLHRLEPVPAGSAALWHPHPWPSTNLIVRGGYEMGVAAGMHDTPLTELRLGAGSFYRMANPEAWHVVRPFAETWSIMVVGQPYTNPVQISKPAKAGESIVLDDPRVREFINEWMSVWVDVELGNSL